MSVYIWLKYWLKIYWGLNSGVIMILQQDEQELTQENTGISYIVFL